MIPKEISKKTYNKISRFSSFAKSLAVKFSLQGVDDYSSNYDSIMDAFVQVEVTSIDWTKHKFNAVYYNFTKQGGSKYYTAAFHLSTSKRF